MEKQYLTPVNRVIRVSEGLIKGAPAGNPGYTVFRGVPYARPPVGELRWAEAEDPEPWEDVLDCTCFRPIALQDRTEIGSLYQKDFWVSAMPMSEDCLYLNIWTPDTTGTERLPILFYIHGGSYAGGYSYEMQFDGEAMNHRGCILVTIDYRVGVLGFFAHPELSQRSPRGISGNYAISDCLQALRWVKRNAAAFGGDPDRITICGQSAGGGMVQTLATCPPARGLFQRAIVMSGGGLSTLGRSEPLEQMEQLGVQVCERLDMSLDALMTLDGEEVRTKIADALIELRGRLFFAPIVDGYYQLKPAGEAIAAGEHFDIDYLTGTVAGDAMMYGGRRMTTMEEYEQHLNARYGALAEEYRALFQVRNAEDLPGFCTALQSAASQVEPRAWAEASLRMGRKPLHIYWFDRRMPGDDAGAYHACELWYVFGTIDRCWRSTAPGFCLGDYALTRAMLDYWTNFARTGDPNGPTVPEWPAYTAERPVTLRLNEQTIGAVDMSDEPLVGGMTELKLKSVYS